MSGEKLWNALFVVPPQRLKGDKAIIRRLVDGLHFHRNRRIIAAIFAATPHRGSQLAESWVGHFAASLIRLPSDVASENPEAATRAGVHIRSCSSLVDLYNDAGRLRVFRCSRAVVCANPHVVRVRMRMSKGYQTKVVNPKETDVRS
jgi:hypothetical protein